MRQVLGCRELKPSKSDGSTRNNGNNNLGQEEDTHLAQVASAYDRLPSQFSGEERLDEKVI